MNYLVVHNGRQCYEDAISNYVNLEMLQENGKEHWFLVYLTYFCDGVLVANVAL